ncbi:MAG: HD family phosphohydrolase [Opitutales bacterium]
MRFFNRKRSKKEEMAKNRRKRLIEASGKRTNLFAANRVRAAALFFVLGSACAFICFFGQGSQHVRLLPGERAQSRVLSSFDFTYISDLRTARAKEEARQKVGTRYQHDRAIFRDFRDRILELSDSLGRQDAFFAMLGENAEEEPWLVIQRAFPIASERRTFLEHKLEPVRRLMQEGVRQPDAENLEDGLVRVYGRSLSEAQRQLRFALLSVDPQYEDLSPEVSDALVSVLSKGIQPNLTPDLQRLQEERAAAAAAVELVRVPVAKGDVILEAGQNDDYQVERFLAYRQLLNEREQWAGFTLRFVRKWIGSLALLGAGMIYITVSLPQLSKSGRRLTLSLLVLFVNLALIRLTLTLGNSDLLGDRIEWLTTVPYLVTVALGPMILTMMIGSAPAVLLAILLSAFNAMMQGNSMEVLIVSLLSSLMAVMFSREVRQRARVIRAGLASGAVTAVSAVALGLFQEELAPVLIAYQVGASLGVGILTGILVVGILPYLENLFHYITDITLLELTDYNHPLLRRLQMVAPGTYHHSLMVANLSERAALDIGCNPLVCRASSLFHDAGKMVKPDYFIENQHPGENPHEEKNPSMSALIIKSHVKEGVEMARQAKLPLLMVDIIQQHHGTTLIRYFYEKARSQQSQTRLPIPEAAGVHPSDDLDEAGFRYDGPRPRFKESGIIFFADAVEAASRTLKKVTAQSIEELIDRIFADRIEDGQLDECPLTCREINLIKRSFTFTLLNMMHARVEYPGRSKSAQVTRAPFVKMPPLPVSQLPAVEEKAAGQPVSEAASSRNN